MNKLLLIIAFFTAIAISVFLYPDGASAVLVCLIAAIIAVGILHRFTTDDAETRRFLLQIFILGLLFRVVIATITHAFDLQAFFCVDALAFDETGAYISAKWTGAAFSTLNKDSVEGFSDLSRSGWGISYLAALFYVVVGRNPLAVQMFISVLGAATPVLVYVCAKQIYSNEKVARVSAIFVMIFPSMVLWSSQILKDGIVIFLLVATFCLILRLRQRFDYKYLALLLVCFALISIFRFYVLLAIIPAIIASIVIDPQRSVRSLVFRGGVILVIAVSLSYFGFLSSIESTAQTNAYNLEHLSNNRRYLAVTAESGYGKDVDVSTVGGALAALPLGFVYLMFAPFPWDVSNFRQSVTIPEVVVWWALFPFLLSGLWYTFRHRLPQAISVLLFLLVLTVTYSISQGNIGTAYRQRSQIQVFYFIFIAVGLGIVLEKRDDAKQLAKMRICGRRLPRPVNRQA